MRYPCRNRDVGDFNWIDDYNLHHRLAPAFQTSETLDQRFGVLRNCHVTSHSCPILFRNGQACLKELRCYSQYSPKGHRTWEKFGKSYLTSFLISD